MRGLLPSKTKKVLREEPWISTNEDAGGSAFSLIASLKVCAKQKDLLTGSRIYSDVLKRGLLAQNVFIGNTLISMYAKCGDLEKAQEVFDTIPARNVVSWNALIAGYSQHRHGKEALHCFERMQLQGFAPDEVTFLSLLKACGSIQASVKGQEIHAQIVREKLLEKHIVVANGLVDMYMKCGALGRAQEVFDELLLRDTVSWNTLIAGYAQHEHSEEALRSFELMQCGGFTPNPVTYACVLKACGHLGALDKGEEIYSQVEKERLLHKHVIVANALIDMFAKCGALVKAQAVFDELLVWDVVSWNALMVGYSQHGHGEKAVKCYEKMQLAGLFPNAFTVACILKACGSIGALGKGRELHAQIVKDHLMEKDRVVANALVDMYAKCGDLEKAQEVFDAMQSRDIVSWTALIAGYADHGYGEEALTCFEKMQSEDLSPNAVTLACALKACGSIGVVDKGQEIHSRIVRECGIEKDVLICTALVDMYATCGMLVEAQKLFDKLPNPDVVLWDVLMVGYAHKGNDEIVLNMFEKMIKENITPNLYTFTVVLNTCCRKGLLNKAQMYFEIIVKHYGIVPTLEHHTCMVDLFGCVGHLDKAAAVIMEMPLSADIRIWLTLLGACRKWGNLKMGKWAFEQAVALDQDTAAYVCMSNIYADVGRQDDASKIEGMRMEIKLGSPSVCFWG